MADDISADKLAHRSFGGYHRALVPPRPDMEILESAPGTGAGEYLRRFWHPVCLSEDLDGGRPLALRIMNEDLVAFRDGSGRVGVLHRKCAHRGTSLEWGIVCETGLRCCYHHWRFDINGRVLETPGEPAGSGLKDSLHQGAYPAVEYRGLVFAYMGPPEEKPDFPVYDSYLVDGSDLVPYSIWHSCNWLHIEENIVDPAHIVFLHSRNAEIQLAPRLDLMPITEYRETDDGHGVIYITSRRVDEFVWTRCIHALMPGFFQAGNLFVQVDDEILYTGAALTRWVVPIDETHCMIFGYRHFHESIDPYGHGRRDECGTEKVDFAPGQTRQRPYEEQQRNPGDWEVTVSQGPIPDHGGEHLSRSDTGVVMMRRQMRRGARGEVAADAHQPQNGWSARATFAYDTVLRLPVRNTGDDDLVAEVGRRTADIVLSAPEEPGPDREAAIRQRILGLKDELLATGH